MNFISRTITGMILVFIGLILIVIGYFTLFTWIYGWPILIIGLFILFNKSEDKIEKIKFIGGKK